MHDIVALVVDIGLGASALYLGRSLSKTVTSMRDIIENHGRRIEALESKTRTP